MNNIHPFALSDNNPAHKKLLRRKRSETRFRLYGLGAIIISISFLAFLLATIFSNGFTAFERTMIKINLNMEYQLAEDKLEPTLENIDNLNFRKIISDGFKENFPEATSRSQILELNELVSKHAYIAAKSTAINAFKQDKRLKDIILWVPASSKIDMLYKGKLDVSGDESERKVSDFQVGVVKKLEDARRLKNSFNWQLLTGGDSREPEIAGIYGSLIGSIFILLICMGSALPIGIGAAIYLEEFAPKSRWKTMAEIGINNLAAVPSIVYGLLGLAVFLKFMGLPRSSTLAGGLTLALLILPIIIVSTRNAIASVPPSIKDAAIALGASKMQVVFHHILPLSLPGIMTGSILSMARALGETAPLLMIGMVAFVRDIPEKITDPATALPVQIFIWSDLPEAGFVEKTSAAIIVLLLLLVIANAFAVYLRRKFEYKW